MPRGKHIVLPDELRPYVERVRARFSLGSEGAAVALLVGWCASGGFDPDRIGIPVKPLTIWDPDVLN